MSNQKMNTIFISEVMKVNEILNDVLVKQEIGIYSRARPTITYLLVKL